MNSNYEMLFKKIILNNKDVKFNSNTLKDDIDIFLEVLNDKERMVIRSIYGLDGDKKTVKEIADILNIKTSSVEVAEKMSLRKLRFLFGLNGKSLTIDAANLKKIASELCSIQQDYDRYYASERGDNESHTTKFYKSIISLCDMILLENKKGKMKVLENN